MWLSCSEYLLTCITIWDVRCKPGRSRTILPLEIQRVGPQNLSSQAHRTANDSLRARFAHQLPTASPHQQVPTDTQTVLPTKAAASHDGESSSSAAIGVRSASPSSSSPEMTRSGSAHTSPSGCACFVNSIVARQPSAESVLSIPSVGDTPVQRWSPGSAGPARSQAAAPWPLPPQPARDQAPTTPPQTAPQGSNAADASVAALSPAARRSAAAVSHQQTASASALGPAQGGRATGALAGEGVLPRNAPEMTSRPRGRTMACDETPNVAVASPASACTVSELGAGSPPVGGPAACSDSDGSDASGRGQARPGCSVILDAAPSCTRCGVTCMMSPNLYGLFEPVWLSEPAGYLLGCTVPARLHGICQAAGCLPGCRVRERLRSAETCS